MKRGTVAELRSRRSNLAVPGSNPRFLEKGAQSPADAVFIDLEDAVVPELKAEGRVKAIEGIGALLNTISD